MIPIRYTRNLFLRGMCVVYLFSFLSFYIQIPGLYGDNGILPARSLLENNKYKSWSAKVHYQPTLLWLAPYLGLDTQYALDVLALLGSFLAFSGFVSQKFCTLPLFAGLWSLYFSLYQVGQVFVAAESFFRDNLLLEAGFLCLLIAPLLPGRRNNTPAYVNHVSFWLVRWLLFRFLFTTGVAKVYNGNWWDLNAFAYHFESMELPSPLSWYAHHLPIWVLRMITIWHIVTLTVLPFLFFVPIRSVRISSYSVQLLLQIFTVLTGNYNFLNLLIVTLLLSLLDDKLFFGKSQFNTGKWTAIFGQIVNLLVHAALIYAVVVVFNLRFSGSQVDAKIDISKDQLSQVVKQSLFVAAYVGLASLTLKIARSVSYAVMDTPGVFSKFIALIRTIFYAALAMLIFISSSVPLSSLHTATNSTISPALRTVHNRLGKLQIVNNYVAPTASSTKGGRLEIILEGADNIDGPWLEYYFLYKPGNVNHSLPFAGPYSPRLDWQMHWAAQSNYKDQPWLLSLVHRMLQGRPEVRSLLDRAHSPFQGKPPKYIRGNLYNYKYTPWSERWQSAWWKREKVGEYFPAFSKDSAALVDYLKARNLLPTPAKDAVNPIWKQVLDSVRYVTSHLEATLLLWSVFTASCAIITTTAKSR
ncbi:hypothetical protein PPYR_14009 [Photinus pyralis]|uniref:Lipase maturation factor n=1 Tax=Photinus pyralis TaxID=7054 RepID=A0A1Y1JX88_PHOPY|nr:lipase maturation factor 2-like isoform X2 [Photinus pyralis]KAB0792048.1 hypothetical protein PPYR_14009 [Photinus pyralis]